MSSKIDGTTNEFSVKFHKCDENTDNKPVKQKLTYVLPENDFFSIANPVSLKTTGAEPQAPTRDAASLKSIKYGPGHEKYPSWPAAAIDERLEVTRGPTTGGSMRSKSWTEHTNYPKEKIVSYMRPYMKKQGAVHTQQKLKTVVERCEKLNPDSTKAIDGFVFFPSVDREGKSIGDTDYAVPSPPERDYNIMSKSYPSRKKDMDELSSCSYSTTPQHLSHLTQAELEEYTRNYENAMLHQHHKQSSYAQSEGYHSYVSSTDSMSTPFLDRLRRDNEANVQGHWGESNDEGRLEGRDSVVTTSSGSVSSSETLKWHGSMSDVSVASSCAQSSRSSKQLIAHSARVPTPQRHNSESVLYISTDQSHRRSTRRKGTSTSQENLKNIPTDSGIKTNGAWKCTQVASNRQNKLKLFPVSTSTVQDDAKRSPESPSSPTFTVAERIHELERQQNSTHRKYTYLDPEKRHRVSDPTLKAIQKKALRSYYERHQSHGLHNETQSRGERHCSSPWRSEPQLHQPALSLSTSQSGNLSNLNNANNANNSTNQSRNVMSESVNEQFPTSRSPSKTQNEVGHFRSQSPPPGFPQTSPKSKSNNQAARRASSASDYAKSSGLWSRKLEYDKYEKPKQPVKMPFEAVPLIRAHQNSNSCGSLSSDLLGPVIVGPTISLDDWVPERPPKNPNLRHVFPDLFKEQATAQKATKTNHVNQRVLTTRLPSPDDLPPPSPPPISETEVFPTDEPFPPPPSELLADEVYACDEKRENQPKVRKEKSKPCEANSTGPVVDDARLFAVCPVLSPRNSPPKSSQAIDRGLNVRSSVRESVRRRVPTPQRINAAMFEEKINDLKEESRKQIRSPFLRSPSTTQASSFVQNRAHERASLRYTSGCAKIHTQKLLADGRVSIAVSQKVTTQGVTGQFRAEPLRAHHLLEMTAQEKTFKSYDSFKQPMSLPHDTNCSLSPSPPSNGSANFKSSSKNYAKSSNSINPSMSISTKPTAKTPTNPVAAANFTNFVNSINPKIALAQNSERKLDNLLGINDKESISDQWAKGYSDENTRPQSLSMNDQEYRDYMDIKKVPSHEPVCAVGPEPLLARSSLVNSSVRRRVQEVNRNDGHHLEKGDPGMTTSKAVNYLAYRRDRGQPDVDNGSYKRTTSPTRKLDAHNNMPSKLNSPVEDWVNSLNTDDNYQPDKSKYIDDASALSFLKMSNNLPDILPVSEKLSGSRRSDNKFAQNSDSISIQNSVKIVPKPFICDTNVNVNTKFTNDIDIRQIGQTKKLEQTSNQRINGQLDKIENCKSFNHENLEQLNNLNKCDKLERKDTREKVEQTESEINDGTKCSIEMKEVKDCASSPIQDEQTTDSNESNQIQLARTDASSQTDLNEDIPAEDEFAKKVPEDEWSEIVCELLKQLEVPEKVRWSLGPQYKKASNYVKNLFKEDAIRPKTVKFPGAQLSKQSSTCESSSRASSAFFVDRSRSNSKDVMSGQFKSIFDLKQKKDEIILRLEDKLESLKEEQVAVQNMTQANNEIGEVVSNLIATKAKQQEISKYRLHVDEVEKITSLLLSLSGRLARAENSLLGNHLSDYEKTTHENKRAQLENQLSEATKLKESIDRRSDNILSMLSKYFDESEYEQYCRFINMKVKLILDVRHISDQIKLTEEQLSALKNA